MQHHDFFLEIGCEELPARCLHILSQALEDNIVKELKSSTLLKYGDIRLFSTPRRLAILIENLQSETTSTTQRNPGPPLNNAFDASGNPTPATLGFAKKNNIDWKALEHDQQINKLVAVCKTESKKTADLLPLIIQKVIADLPIPKPMRWGNHRIQFARPVHWVVMIYNNQLVPATILNCKTTTETHGHRIHAPESISLLTNNYVPSLKNAFVIADFNERKAEIKKQLIQAAATLNTENGFTAEPVLLNDLLDEVTGLVEWPVALLVPFNERFLKLPQEVLITSMQQHQKSFAIKKNNQLTPYFLTVANIESKDKKQVVNGNKRVMEARLSDAEFFYEKDQQKPLADYREATKHVIFQAKLGTLYDKSERFIALANYLAPLFNINKADAERAAFLSQCDLMTDMVGEFPELQGTMGAYYAQSSGENSAVSKALDEQYWPRFSGDKLPESSLGTLLAIAERVDTIIGAFSINQKPTGNKDPFKLRRHALGLIRLLMKSNDIHLLDLLSYSFTIFAKNNPQAHSKTIEETHAFILERLKSYYIEEKGLTINVIQAVLAQQSTLLYDFDLRVHAVHEFSTWTEAPALAAANKRVQRILSGETSFISTEASTISSKLLIESAEKNLVDALYKKQQLLPELLITKNYIHALKTLATLREPIDAFFDTVMVNAEDQALRQNRLAILKALQQLFLSIADLSCLS